MYLQHTGTLGLFHWWGIAPPAVARAVCTAGVTVATDGAGAPVAGQACGKVFKDAAPGVPKNAVPSAPSTNSPEGLTPKALMYGAAGVVALALLLRR